MADPDTFRVSPSLQGLPGVSAPPVESAGPAMLVRAGQTLQRAGGVANELFQRELREQNATRVTESLVELTEYQHRLTYDPDNGWAAQRGKTALERASGQSLDEEVGGDFDNFIELKAMELGNDAQRNLFRERALAMSADLRGRVQQHVGEQGLIHRKGVLTGTIETNQRLMGEADDPADLERYASMTQQAASQLADLAGLADEERDSFYRQQLTPGHLGVLSRMQANGDIEGAESYFHAHRDELTYEATVKIETALIEQRVIMEGGEIGEAIAGMAGAQNAAAAPQDIGMPVTGAYRQTGSFGEARPGHRHDGVDFAMDVGTPVYAGAAGVAHIKRDPKGYGLYVDLKLDNGTTLRMAHLSGTEIEDGQRVPKGAMIARSGSSGRSTGPHLHYEVIGADGAKVDPLEFHQSKPRVETQAAGATLQDQLQTLYSKNLPPRIEAEAERKIRSLYGAQREAEQESKEQLRSRAFAEVDSSGKLSSGMRSQLVSAGMGDMIPQLRSFEESKAARASGATLDPRVAVANLGIVREQIAAGKITSADQLLPYAYDLTPGDLRTLTNELTKDPQDARRQADSVVTLMNEEIEGTGLFRDEDGKETPETKKEKSRFLGAVTRQIEVEQAKGPVTPERQREIVLGMLGRTSINALGVEVPRYRVRGYYDRIPAGERARIERSLQRQNIPVPSQAQVVSAWLRMRGQGE